MALDGQEILAPLRTLLKVVLCFPLSSTLQYSSHMCENSCLLLPGSEHGGVRLAVSLTFFARLFRHSPAGGCFSSGLCSSRSLSSYLQRPLLPRFRSSNVGAFCLRNMSDFNIASRDQFRDHIFEFISAREVYEIASLFDHPSFRLISLHWVSFVGPAYCRRTVGIDSVSKPRADIAGISL